MIRSHYSLPGHITLILPAVQCRRNRELKEVKIRVEGRAEYYDDAGKFGTQSFGHHGHRAHPDRQDATPQNGFSTTASPSFLPHSHTSFRPSRLVNPTRRMSKSLSHSTSVFQVGYLHRIPPISQTRATALSSEVTSHGNSRHPHHHSRQS